MIKQGYALEKISSGEELLWWENLPASINVPGELITVDAAQLGWEFEDYRLVEKEKEFEEPIPSRRVIEKAVIIERLTDAQLEAAISLMSVRQQERWRMPGYPVVYADDPEVVGLIQAVGADPEVVLA